MDKSEDKITCRLYGVELEIVGTHLAGTHGICASDYLVMFPDAETL